MSTAPVSGTTSTGNSVQNSTRQTFNKEDFLKLLVTQLKYQNPLQPTDNNEFMMQLTQFSMLETLQALKTSSDEMFRVEMMRLIGTRVEAALPGGEGTISGIVSSVKFQEGVPYLNVDGRQVSLSQILEVSRDPDAAQEGGAVEP
ncbi:MAG: flagellar hook assembly protein FlgD [Bacillota bacterium]